MKNVKVKNSIAQMQFNCKICGLPIEKGEKYGCTEIRNCLNTTIKQEEALKN